MEHKAVKKKWASLMSKNLANLQESFRKRNFLDFYVDYNGFSLKKKLDQYNKR